VAPFVNIQFLGSSLTFMMVRGSPACRQNAPSVPSLRTAKLVHMLQALT